MENQRQIDDHFMEAIKAEFGVKLRRLRRARDLSQDELGRKVGLKRGSIAMIEGGKQNTLLHHVFQFARELDASVTELLPTREEIMHRARLPNLPEADRKRASWEMALQDAREQLKQRRSAYEQKTNAIPDTSSD